MKTFNSITIGLLTLLVACAPQKNPRARYKDKTIAVTPEEALKAKKIAEAEADINRKRRTVKTQMTKENSATILLRSIQNIAFIRSESNEIQKAYVFTVKNPNGLELIQDKTHNNWFSNETNTNATERFKVYVVNPIETKTEITIVDSLNGGEVAGYATLFSSDMKALALTNEAKRIIVRDGKTVVEASEELTSKINAVEAQLTGQIIYSELNLVSKANKDETIVRKKIDFGKTQLLDEKFNNEASQTKVEGVGLQYGTVNSIESTGANKITLSVTIVKVIVEIVLQNEAVDAQRAAELKAIADEYVKWAETIDKKP